MTTANDVCIPTRRTLAEFFSPTTVAVIGAIDTPGTVGRTLMENLASFRGAVYPVNPKRAEVLGVKAYSSVAAVPEPIDLAVIVTPAAAVPGVVEQCAAARVPAAIVISAVSRRPARRARNWNWTRWRLAAPCASSAPTAWALCPRSVGLTQHLRAAWRSPAPSRF